MTCGTPWLNRSVPRWPWRKRQTAEELIAESRAAQPADPRAADQATVDHLRAAGGDLDKVTHVIHYVYLPDEPAARACQAELEVSGFGVRTFPPDRDVPAWSLHVDHEMVVSVDSITEAREKLAGAATRHGGDYDGWEAAVTR